MVVIIMPTLPKGNEGQQWVVTAIITSGKTLGAEKMGKRINRIGAVIQKHRRDKETPDQHLHGSCGPTMLLQKIAQTIHGEGQNNRSNQRPFINENKFGEFGIITNRIMIGPAVIRVQKPSHMGPQKPMVPR